MRSLAVVSLCLSVAHAEDALDPGMVAQDVAIAKRVAAALPADDAPLASFLKALAPCRTDENRDIGFGARLIRVALDGQYAGTSIAAIVWKDHVGPIEVVCRADDEETWAKLKDAVAKPYASRQPDVRTQELRVQVGHRAGPDAFRKARSAVLGGPLGIEPHPDLAETYAWLWSPFTDLRYGACEGEDGDAPDGRIAIEKIVAHERGAALLEDLLVCPNPESRVYAAEWLLRLERKGRALPDRVRRAIEAVRDSDVKIQVCNGCLLSAEPAKEMLAEMLADAK